MASAGMNSAFDELFGEGPNSENDQGNPEICYNDEFYAQMVEDRRMQEFGFMDSDCEDGSIQAQMFNIDNQGYRRTPSRRGQPLPLSDDVTG